MANTGYDSPASQSIGPNPMQGMINAVGSNSSKHVLWGKSSIANSASTGVKVAKHAENTGTRIAALFTDRRVRNLPEV